MIRIGAIPLPITLSRRADDGVTITIGAAQLASRETAQELIRRAEIALYLGKEAGRDRLVLDENLFNRFVAKIPEGSRGPTHAAIARIDKAAD